MKGVRQLPVTRQAHSLLAITPTRLAHAPAGHHQPSDYRWPSRSHTSQHVAHVPVQIIYSKSPSCLCLGVVCGGACTFTRSPAGLRVFRLCLQASTHPPFVFVCASGRSSTSPSQTNPWAIITSSPQLKCLSYFIYSWYTSVFPKTMESLWIRVSGAASKAHSVAS